MKICAPRKQLLHIIETLQLQDDAQLKLTADSYMLIIQYDHQAFSMYADILEIGECVVTVKKLLGYLQTITTDSVLIFTTPEGVEIKHVTTSSGDTTWD